jgi:hypothetical protein
MDIIIEKNSYINPLLKGIFILIMVNLNIITNKKYNIIVFFDRQFLDLNRLIKKIDVMKVIPIEGNRRVNGEINNEIIRETVNPTIKLCKFVYPKILIILYIIEFASSPSSNI